MKELELNELWSNYDKKLDRLISCNHKTMEGIMKLNSNNSLARHKSYQKWGIIIGIPWLAFLAFLIFIGIKTNNYFFSISFGIIYLCTLVAIASSIYHITLINKVIVSTSVVKSQARLSVLKSSSLFSTRIVLLQLPFWTTWYLQFQNGFLYWGINGAITLLFSLMAIWLYRNIRMDNLENKVVKWLFSDTEWTSIIAASDMLHQIEAIKK